MSPQSKRGNTNENLLRQSHLQLHASERKGSPTAAEEIHVRPEGRQDAHRCWRSQAGGVRQPREVSLRPLDQLRGVYDPAEYWNEIHKHKPPTPKLTDVRIDEEDGTYIVVPVFAGLDRPDSSQYWCGKKENLARRLRDAIYAGVVLEDITHEIDINGRSYASFGMNVRMRCLNADLKKLGY